MGLEEASIAKSPGKCMITGDHSVMYDQPAGGFAIDENMYVFSEELEEGFKIYAPDISKEEADYKWKGDKLVPEDEDISPHVRRSAEMISKERGREINARVTTLNDMDLDWGVGTSSTATLGTLYSLNNLFEAGLDEEEILDLGYQVKLDVEGGGSITALSISNYGGFTYLEDLKGEGGIEKIVPEKAHDELSLIIGHTGIKGDTPKALEIVRNLKSDYETVEGIIDVMGTNTKEMKDEISNGDWERVGKLMNMYHGQLESLHVNIRELNDLVYTAREAGAYGAKTSGGGLGDIMVAISSPERKEEVVESIKKAGGNAVSPDINWEGTKLISKEELDEEILERLSDIYEG